MIVKIRRKQRSDKGKKRGKHSLGNSGVVSIDEVKGVLNTPPIQHDFKVGQVWERRTKEYTFEITAISGNRVFGLITTTYPSGNGVFKILGTFSVFDFVKSITPERYSLLSS